MSDNEQQELTLEDIADQALTAGRMEVWSELSREEIMKKVINMIQNWTEEQIRATISSDELNQRITCAVDDADFPNEGSMTAALVQEELHIQFRKDGLIKRDGK